SESQPKPLIYVPDIAVHPFAANKIAAMRKAIRTESVSQPPNESRFCPFILLDLGQADASSLFGPTLIDRQVGVGNDAQIGAVMVGKIAIGVAAMLSHELHHL